MLLHKVQYNFIFKYFLTLNPLQLAWRLTVEYIFKSNMLKRGLFNTNIKVNITAAYLFALLDRQASVFPARMSIGLVGGVPNPLGSARKGLQ